MNFAEIASELLGDLERGLSPAAIANAMPVALVGLVPKTLMLFWQQVGAADSLLESFQHIATPAKITMHGEHLLFMEENQGVSVWGCACDAYDPPVFQYVVTEADLDGPYPENVCLSDFLQAMLVMQVVQSDLLAHTGYELLPIGEGTALLSSHMRALPPVGGFYPFIGDDIAVGVIVDGEQETVLAATNSSEAFARLAALLGIDPEDFTV